MKIALSQLNYHIGNFPDNGSKIREHIAKATEKRAHLVVFSELALSGYPARDLLEKDYVDRCLEELSELAALSHSTGIIIGCPSYNLGRGKPLSNSAFYLYEGKIKARVDKGLLPDYDVFDELRYFEPATSFSCINHLGTKIALTICEDLWNVSSGNLLPAYASSPMEALSREKPELMINIAASPFHYQQVEIREQVLKANATTYRLPLIYVNQVGAQTELIFDGGSLVMDEQGQVVKQLGYFCEDFAVVDIETSGAPVYAENLRNMSVSIPDLNPVIFMEDPVYTERIYKACVLSIRDYFKKMNFGNAVLGLSGGIDSAVVCALAAEALGAGQVTGVLLPSAFSSEHSVTDARQLAGGLGIKTHEIPITEAVAAYESMLAPLFVGRPADIAEENIQSRCRAVTLMALSNKFGLVLLNTSNKSEAAVGYGTLYGDMTGAISVIGDLYKTQIYALAHFINRNAEIIPWNTIVKPPSAELRPNQKDSDSLPEYSQLDTLLFLHVEKRYDASRLVDYGFDLQLVMRILQLVKNAEFKRHQMPPVLRVSPKAFGMGRRMPIVSLG